MNVIPAGLSERERRVGVKMEQQIPANRCRGISSARNDGYGEMSFQEET